MVDFNNAAAADVPEDYETDQYFQPDWDNCDGYGGCD